MTVSQNHAAGAHLKRAAHFFDGKHDTGQGRIEGTCDTCRSTCQNKTDLAFGGNASRQEHDCGTDLNRRSLTTRRGANHQAKQCQDDLANCGPDADKFCAACRPFQAPCCDCLRNTRALSAGKIAVGRPGQSRQSQLV